MCYNNCKIKIESCIDGCVNIVSATGTVDRTRSEVRFYYKLDGDECKLAVNACQAEQSRRGEQNIQMTFREGEQTECSLASGGFSGKFTVFTHKLIFCDGDVCKLFICYSLGEQKTELNFSAEEISR